MNRALDMTACPNPVLDAVVDAVPHFVSRFVAVSELYIFGSVAAGRCGDRSDVDVAVYLDWAARKEDPLIDLKMASWLEDRLGRPADVVTLNHASDVLRYEVLRSGIRLFERSAEHRALLELRAFKGYLDMRHFQRRRQEATNHGQ